MKSFEKTVRRRLLYVVSFGAVFGAAIVAAFVLKLTGAAGIGSLLSVELLAGLLAGTAAVSFYRVKKYRKVLKDPEALEELHIRETDERNRVVGLKACRATLNAALALLGFAGIVLSFINQAAYYAVVAVLVVLLALYGAFSLYYARKY